MILLVESLSIGGSINNDAKNQTSKITCVLVWIANIELDIVRNYITLDLYCNSKIVTSVVIENGILYSRCSR